MDWFWWIVLLGISTWFLLRKRKFASNLDFERAKLNWWLLQKGFKLADVNFSVHVDTNILSEGAERIVVGFGPIEGKSEGFYAELASDGTVMDARIIHPGAASYHQSLAREASLDASLLAHKLTSKSLEMNIS